MRADHIDQRVMDEAAEFVKECGHYAELHTVTIILDDNTPKVTCEGFRWGEGKYGLKESDLDLEYKNSMKL
jgi:hypothetical protein